MARRVNIDDGLDPRELELRYRKARDPVERSHHQIIWLLAQGKTAREVASVTGYSTKWIGTIAHRYSVYGPQGLGDRRHRNPGAVPFLSQEQAQELEAALLGPAPAGGVWNCRRVAEWIEARIGRKVSLQRGWDYLQRLAPSANPARSRRKSS